jgi:L-seryl-tRNA(Ser) seleniumtransferase
MSLAFADDTETTPPGRDRFGNPIDPSVGYARGRVLDGEIAESLRQECAYGVIRERYARLGDAGLFNLTGLIRAFPYADDDQPAMRSYVHFIARSKGELERLALERMGGDPARHAGFLSTRVSAGMLAIMLGVLGRGERVLSLVPDDRSHPSVRRAAELAGGTFNEVLGIAAFAAALAVVQPSVVVVTAISPSKRHLPLADTERAIELAHRAGAIVVLDDAHMAARLALYDEPPALSLGADVAVWSLDKHLGGPRSGFVAARADLARRIKARALALGLEAQLGQWFAGLHAVESFDPAPVRAAGKQAEHLLETLASDTEGRAYLAGAGVAVSGEDLLELAARRAGVAAPPLVPIEAVAYASMTMLRAEGAVLIPAVGMPGAACTFRLMMYPDGARLGEAAIVRGWRDAFTALVGALGDPERAPPVLLGEAALR